MCIHIYIYECVSNTVPTTTTTIAAVQAAWDVGNARGNVQSTKNSARLCAHGPVQGHQAVLAGSPLVRGRSSWDYGRTRRALLQDHLEAGAPQWPSHNISRSGPAKAQTPPRPWCASSSSTRRMPWRPRSRSCAIHYADASFLLGRPLPRNHDGRSMWRTANNYQALGWQQNGGQPGVRGPTTEAAEDVSWG